MVPRVLIVDDERTFSEILGELLADEGYCVARAHDGVTALNMLASERLSPDLLLCDVMLPGLRGDRLAAEVRRRFPKRRLPIVLLSASPNPHVRVPDVSFLAKPIDFKELLDTIERLVEPGRRVPATAAS
jgi:two-component system response regulator MprA